MTAALILTASSHTITCAYCNAPWPLGIAQCPGCGCIAVASITARAAAPSPDDLRAQLAAVTAERDALRAGDSLLAAIIDQLAAHPRYLTDPLLAACVEQLRRGADPATIIAQTMVAYADDRARLLDLATRASVLNGPVILAPVDAFSAPAHNPGARVVATGGGR